MNRNRIIGASVLIVLGIIFIYSTLGDHSPGEYSELISKERDEQERFMKYSSESPFVIDSLKYGGLTYYPPDMMYKIKGRFEKTEKPAIRTLATNDGKEEQYLEYGVARFNLEGKEHTLLILENVTEDVLFLAFGDETSAIETYGAGRYLDVEHAGGSTITLDFNLAYNPYCAYSEVFSCPLPPKENLLDVAIKAGEKTYSPL